MTSSSVALRPIHYASVSGGKDSIYMLKVILANPQKYPLDMVVNFDLEIEHPVAHRVVDRIEEMCKRMGIVFWRIKPTRTWEEVFAKYGLPSRMVRWCNKEYKMTCDRQLRKWIKEQHCRPVAYIGLCSDEKKRHRYDIGSWDAENADCDLCYPLAEEGIEEWTVLSWAREQEMFEGFYRVQTRMGCRFCPCSNYLSFAYDMVHYPEEYKKFRERIIEREEKRGEPWLRLNGGFWPEVEKNIVEKYVPMVYRREKGSALERWLS